MRLGALFSGGKDSVFSIYKAIKLGHDVRVLITIFSKNRESYMYHVPNIELTKLQSSAMEIPIIIRESMGIKEEELLDLEFAIHEAKKDYKLDGIVSGAIYSNYQRRRIDDICEKSQLTSLVPLWKRKPKEMLFEMIDAGFCILMIAVAAGGLEQDWLGREITREVVNELSKLHDTCYVCTGGEGGEFETLVVDCPLFKKKLKVLDAEPHWDGQAGWFEIKNASLEIK